MKRTRWAVPIWIMLAVTAHAASFDCSKASTPVEQMICGDADLSSLDKKLTSAYRAILQDDGSVDALKSEQRAWLKLRNRCQDVACLKAAYNKRLSTLNAVEVPNATDSNEDKTPAPDVIKQTLLSCSSDDVRCDDAKQLSNKLNICEERADSVEIHRVKLVPKHTHVVLQINSLSGCAETYLVVLQESKPNTWSHLQTIVLANKHVTPRVSFDSLISPNETEIIVRDNETDSGTGIQQIDMTIWKLVRERLVVVFDEATYVNFGISLNADQEEHSDFVFINAKSGKEIRQKQVIRDHRTRITRWWSWFWDSSVERFRKYATWPEERGPEPKGSSAH